ncbi:MAG: DMT family transporter [Albidovulum sp.]
MRLLILTAVTMTAFAANSVLNRLALKGGMIDALDFAAIRLASGAFALWVLLRLTGRVLPRGDGLPWLGAGALLLYVTGFSLAYLALDAGAGALILFGGVQITMFAGAIAVGEHVPPRRWFGAGLALLGLAWLLWPSEVGSLPFWPALSMAAAALGWGVYSLAGRGGADPLAKTTGNFLLAAVAVPGLVLLADRALPPSPAGIGLALVSGVLTSGLGYALWYRILPALGAGRAGVAQLSVPVIAALGGAVFLAEVPDLRFLLASAVVLAGVGLAVLPQK